MQTTKCIFPKGSYLCRRKKKKRRTVVFLIPDVSPGETRVAYSGSKVFRRFAPLLPTLFGSGKNKQAERWIYKNDSSPGED